MSLELVTWIAIFVLGYMIIYYCADYILDLLEDFSKAFRVSPIIAGIFILGIDLEESSVSLLAAFNNLPYISIGNLIGNTIMAITLVFGMPVLFYRINFRQLPSFYYVIVVISVISIVAAAAFPQFLLVSAIFNLLLFTVYTLKSMHIRRDYREALAQGKLSKQDSDDEEDESASKGSIAVKLLLAIAAILISGEILLLSAEQMMALTNLSQTFFGLVIMAYVTNVEEVFIIFIAIRKKQAEIGLAAEIGKILWNITLIYGVSGVLLMQYTFETIMFASSLILLAVVFLLMINLVRNKFTRAWGVLFLAIFAFYTVLNVLVLF